jgi:site-specific DNA recombinase
MRRVTEPPDLSDHLLERILSRENMQRAWKRVKSNKGTHGIEAASADQKEFLRLADNIETFLERLRATAETLNVTERQKVLRLVAKEILVYPNTIKIKHSLPVSRPNTPVDSSGGSEIPGYLLRSWSHLAAVGQHPAGRPG